MADVKAEEIAKMSGVTTAAPEQLIDQLEAVAPENNVENSALSKPKDTTALVQNLENESQLNMEVPAQDATEQFNSISEPTALGEIQFITESSNLAPVADPNTSQALSGTWHSSSEYVEHLLRSLNQQRSDAQNCDFTVQVQGTRFAVHKCVLSAASPYLQQRLQEAETELSSAIILDQVSPSCFGKLLDFIYVGKVFMDKQSVKDLQYAAQVYQLTELETLCKSYSNEKDQGTVNKSRHKVTKESSQKQDVVICKTEPPDSDEFGKTLKALNDNLSDDSDLMSSLIESQTYNVINEILAKLNGTTVSKNKRGRRKGTPRRKQTKTVQEPKNSAKQTAKSKKETAKKEEKKPAKKIKKEPVEFKDDLDDVKGFDEITEDMDDEDNDPDFDDDLDDEDCDETYDPSEGKLEHSSSGRKRRLSSRNIRTGKVLRSAKKLKTKPQEKKEPKEKRKRKERRGRITAFDTLKEKLESLSGEELADLGIRKLEENETMEPADFPFTVNGTDGSTLDVSSLPLNSLQPGPPLVPGQMPVELVGNGVTIPPNLIISPSQDSAKGNYCVYCKSSFKSSEALLIHKEQMHRNIRCEHCNKLFIRQEHLSRHINKEHVKIFPDLICKQCNKDFKFTKKFMKHMEEEHKISKPFECQFEGCTSRFRNINQLGHHHNTHQTERTLICPTCGNSYRTKETLLCHMQRCRNVRDKLCDTCGAAFTNNQDLRQHIQIMHSGLRLYVCAVCGKDFSCPSNLRRHKRIHDNAFPYKCNCCPASFRYSNTLKHHLQNKHNIQPPANSIVFRERKAGGRPPGDHPGAGNRRKTIEAANTCRFLERTQDHRVRSHDQTGQNSGALVGGNGRAQNLTLDQQQDGAQMTTVDTNGTTGHRTLECEINAAVQSIETQHQLNLDNNTTVSGGAGSNYTLASSMPPLAVMPTYRNQPTSAHVNLGPNNPSAPSWPVAGAPPTANMAAMLNAENATNTMIQHAHAMSALYHTPWGMGQH